MTDPFAGRHAGHQPSCPCRVLLRALARAYTRMRGDGLSHTPSRIHSECVTDFRVGNVSRYVRDKKQPERPPGASGGGGRHPDAAHGRRSETARQAVTRRTTHPAARRRYRWAIGLDMLCKPTDGPATVFCTRAVPTYGEHAKSRYSASKCPRSQFSVSFHPRSARVGQGSFCPMSKPCGTPQIRV